MKKINLDAKINRSNQRFPQSLITPTKTVGILNLIRMNLLDNSDIHFFLPSTQIKQIAYAMKLDNKDIKRKIEKLPHFAVVSAFNMEDKELTKRINSHNLNFIVAAQPNNAFLTMRSMAGKTKYSKDKLEVYSTLDRYKLKWTRKQVTTIDLNDIEIRETQQLYYINKLDVFKDLLGVIHEKRAYQRKHR